MNSLSQAFKGKTRPHLLYLYSLQQNQQFTKTPYLIYVIVLQSEIRIHSSQSTLSSRRKQMNSHRLPLLTMLFLICTLFLFSACVGGKQSNSVTQAAPENEKIELGAIEEVQAATVLKTSYDNIIIRKFTSSSQLQTDYPDSIKDCKTNIIKQLKKKKAYKNVTDSSKNFPGKVLSSI